MHLKHSGYIKIFYSKIILLTPERQKCSSMLFNAHQSIVQSLHFSWYFSYTFYLLLWIDALKLHLLSAVDSSNCTCFANSDLSIIFMLFAFFMCLVLRWSHFIYDAKTAVFVAGIDFLCNCVDFFTLEWIWLTMVPVKILDRYPFLNEEQAGRWRSPKFPRKKT